MSADFLLERHAQADWGDSSPSDWFCNDQSLIEGRQLMSAYILPDSKKRVWVVTEWDRSVTTLLLPEEY